MPLMRQGRTDLDFLGAVIHGRRSRLAEAERLDALCRIRTVGELVRAVAPEGGVETVADFQRRLVADLVRELTDIAHQTDGAVNDLLAWLCVRFQVENLKVLARGFATKSAPEDVRAHLISLPGVADLDVAAFVRAPSLGTSPPSFRRRRSGKASWRPPRSIAGTPGRSSSRRGSTGGTSGAWWSWPDGCRRRTG